MTSKAQDISDFLNNANRVADEVNDEVMAVMDTTKTDPITFSLALLKVAGYHYGAAAFAQAFHAMGGNAPSAEAVSLFTNVMRDTVLATMMAGVEHARESLGVEPPSEGQLIVPGLILPPGVH